MAIYRSRMEYFYGRAAETIAVVVERLFKRAVPLWKRGLELLTQGLGHRRQAVDHAHGVFDGGRRERHGDVVGSF